MAMLLSRCFNYQFDNGIEFFHFSDVNECARGTAMCAHNCQDTPGSYTCSCRSGYALDVDGRTCSSMNNYYYCLLKELKKKRDEREKEGE